MHVCVRMQGCVNADVRACGGGCMHICVKSVRVSFLILHHLRPGNLQWGWLACTANTQTLVLLVLLLLDPLLSNHWLLLDHQGVTRGYKDGLQPETLADGKLDHHGFTSTRDTELPQKQLLYSPDAGLWIFVISKASGRSLFDHSFRPYIYAFIRKNRIYTYYTVYIYAG